jgi:hypothetical protein
VVRAVSRGWLVRSLRRAVARKMVKFPRPSRVPPWHGGWDVGATLE